MAKSTVNSRIRTTGNITLMTEGAAEESTDTGRVRLSYRRERKMCQAESCSQMIRRVVVRGFQSEIGSHRVAIIGAIL